MLPPLATLATLAALGRRAMGLGCSARAALRTPEEHLHLHRAADLRSQRHPMVLPPASSLCPSCPSRTPSRISHPISRLPTSGRRRRRRPSGLRARGTISSVGLGRARQGAPAVRRGVAAARARRKRARARLRPRAARPVTVVCSQPATVCARPIAELGSGLLALPGLVAHLLGAHAALLTDRRAPLEL